MNPPLLNSDFIDMILHYWRVEDETFLENLRQGVNDFYKFREEIKEILKKER